MVHIALCGNPNTGKTTLFNQWTGRRAHVGNYPGITVEQREGEHRAADGSTWRIHDLPGAYSLTAYSPEEEIAHHALTGGYGAPPPDVAVVVIDATNLARNLLLLLQVAELGRPVVAALNMMDAAKAEGLAIDCAGLSTSLGCPVVPIVARSGQGLAELEQAVAGVLRAPESGRIAACHWSVEVQTAIAALRAAHPRLAAAPEGEVLWWLGADQQAVQALDPGLAAAMGGSLPRDPDPDRDVRRRLVHERYARIDGLVATALRRERHRPRTPSDRIDDVLLHPIAGGLIFVLAMAALFQAVFAWAQPLADGVAALMDAVAGLARDHLPDTLVRAVLIDGVLSGVAGTLVFLPQILVLFLGIAVLEDSGYLSRAAFLADRLMSRVGLPGKAFVPLLSSYACAVPGILSARTMSDPRDRLLTILIAPLMSCSARLPVYTLVTAAVFAGNPKVFGVLSVGGLIVAAMYALGFVLALAAAAVFRRTVVPGAGAPLLLEMPPYRWPRPRNILRVLWDRGFDFVTTTGTTIVILSVILWALMSFPREGLPPVERARLTAQAERVHSPGPDRDRAIAAIEVRDAQVRLERSIAGHIGKAIEPVIAPLGFDWRIGIGLVGSFAAREVLVPVMAQIYGKGSQADVDDRFASDVGRSMAGAGALTPLSGLSLMVFFAIAMQCLSTMATIARETGGWKWAMVALVYLNSLAWLASLAVYQGGRLLGYM